MDDCDEVVGEYDDVELLCPNLLPGNDERSQSQAGEDKPSVARLRCCPPPLAVFDVGEGENTADVVGGRCCASKVVCLDGARNGSPNLLMACAVVSGG